MTVNGRQLRVDGERLLVVDVGTRWFQLILLVLGFVQTISTIFALTFVALGIAGEAPWPIGVVSLVVAVACGGLIWLVVKHPHLWRLPSRDESSVVVVFDLGSQRLLSGSGMVLAPLASVVVRRRSFTLTSSGIATLVVSWPGGSTRLVSEGPFSTGFDSFVEELSSRGIAVS